MEAKYLISVEFVSCTTLRNWLYVAFYQSLLVQTSDICVGLYCTKKLSGKKSLSQMFAPPKVHPTTSSL